MQHAPRLPLLALALCLPAFACSSDDGGGETTVVGEGSTTTTGAPPDTTTGMPPATTTTGVDGTSTTAAPATSSTGEPDPSTSEDSGPPISFDFPALPDAPPIDESCGQVDFLFVIDNSGSMGDEQLALVNNFPNFINGIEATLKTVETIHVGVSTSDDYFYNVAGCQQIGGLVVQTGGFDSSMMACGPYDEGANYMTEMDDLDITFACAAQVGTEGSANEQPMQAVVNAVTGVYGDNGECNEGFIREDALLVIVIITDESDSSAGTAMSWYDDVVAAKAGIPENVVVVSLINVPGSPCNPFDPAQTIADFTMMFGKNGFMAEICLPDFAPIFDQAVAIIDVACDNYIPPN
jgi:hypothetical protein